MISAAIIGASGYTGYELVKMLSNHPKVELIALNSDTYGGKQVKSLYRDFESDLKFTSMPMEEINKKANVVFLALPHGKAMEVVPRIKCRIIDLSADYRFRNPLDYEKAYGVTHKDKASKAAYGLPELFRDNISHAKLVANPGCYATGMILSAYPLHKDAKHIVFDCKSGWSGAGKSSPYANDPKITKDNIIAYKLTRHRHKYEVEQFIKASVSFTPHVIDTFQGMMVTSHILLNKGKDINSIKKAYRELYSKCPFVDVVDGIPDLHQVQKTNRIIIGGFEIDESNQLVIVAVLDNLIKGASGQAVQNMNLMFGFDESEGLA